MGSSNLALVEVDLEEQFFNPIRECSIYQAGGDPPELAIRL